MPKPPATSSRPVLDEILSRRILVLDGSMGALIYAQQPTEEDYRGTRFASTRTTLKNCTEVLVLTQPQLIEDIHRAYLEAGADIIETNTFNGNALVAGRVRPRGARRRVNRPAAELARRAADEFTRRNPDKPRFVAGSIGPTNKTALDRRRRRRPRLPRRHLRRDGRRLQRAGRRPGRRRASISCCPRPSFDTLVMKACLFAIDKYFERARHRACR